MSEIKSTVTIVERYVSGIKSANDNLKSDSVSVTEDVSTNLVVNKNSTSLNKSSQQAISAISKQISDDCGRITSIAALFEEKDKALAKGK